MAPTPRTPRSGRRERPRRLAYRSRYEKNSVFPSAKERVIRRGRAADAFRTYGKERMRRWSTRWRNLEEGPMTTTKTRSHVNERLVVAERGVVERGAASRRLVRHHFESADGSSAPCPLLLLLLSPPPPPPPPPARLALLRLLLLIFLLWGLARLTLAAEDHPHEARRAPVDPGGTLVQHFGGCAEVSVPRWAAPGLRAT